MVEERGGMGREMQNVGGARNRPKSWAAAARRR
jgi:hypothetical protein